MSSSKQPNPTPGNGRSSGSSRGPVTSALASGEYGTPPQKTGGRGGGSDDESPSGPPKRGGKARVAAGGAKDVGASTAKEAAKESAKQAVKQSAKKAATEGAKGTVKGATKGAEAGAKVGSYVPVVGTAIGGVVGGIVGAPVGGVAGTAKGAAQGAAEGATKGAAEGAGKGAKKGIDKAKKRNEDHTKAKAAKKSSGKSKAKKDSGGLVGDITNKADNLAEPEGPSTAEDDEKATIGATEGALKGAGLGHLVAAKEAATGKFGKAAKTAGGATAKNAALMAATVAGPGAAAARLTGAAKGAKKGAGKGGLIAVATMPLLAILAAMFLLVGLLNAGQQSGPIGARSASVGAAVDNGVPAGIVGSLAEAQDATGTPWQMIAAVGHIATSSGTRAPDGKTRSAPSNTITNDLEEVAGIEDEEEEDASDLLECTAEGGAAGDDTTTTTEAEDGAAGDDTTTTTAAADDAAEDDTTTTTAAEDDAADDDDTTTTTEAEDGAAGDDTTTTTEAGDDAADECDGAIYPVVIPPIVDDADGGPWLGTYLAQSEAFTEDGHSEADAQDHSEASKWVGRRLATSIAEVDGYSYEAGYEANTDAWVEAVLALPAKGLNGETSNQTNAEIVVATGIAWINGEDACAGAGTGAGAGASAGAGAVAAALPTGGPVAIGDTLDYEGVVFGESAWQHAVTTATVARDLGVSDRGLTIALATMIVETGLINYASEVYPETITDPRQEAVGSDHDSVGLYQQRPQSGWGDPLELLDTTYSVRAFFGGPTGPNGGGPRGLLDVAGWETMDPGDAAQTVQVSAFPGKYAQAMASASSILATINASFGSGPIAGGPVPPPTEVSADVPAGDVEATSATAPVADDATTDTTAGADGEDDAGAAPGPTDVLVLGDQLVAAADEASNRTDEGTVDDPDGDPDGDYLPQTWTVRDDPPLPAADAALALGAAGASPATREAVVIALGTVEVTGDPVPDEAAMTTIVENAMSTIGDTVPTYWVTIDPGFAADPATAEVMNAAVTAVAADHENLDVVDWAAEVPDDAQRDGDVYDDATTVAYGEFLTAVPEAQPTAVTPEAEVCAAGADDAGAGGDASAPAAPIGVVDLATGGAVDLCPAASIPEVNCQIAPNVTAMISAAGADGVTLTGGGYRDPQRQIELRRQHCGTSNYAVYEMPSSECSPPTATPGASQHEVGLAIDFEDCSTRSTACYQWLAAKAEQFGMFNLPSEPWHWSVDGT